MIGPETRMRVNFPPTFSWGVMQVMQCDDKPLDVSLTRISPNLYQPACRMSSPPPESGHLEPILGACIAFCSFAVFCIHEPCRAIFLIQKILS